SVDFVFPPLDSASLVTHIESHEDDAIKVRDGSTGSRPLGRPEQRDRNPDDPPDEAQRPKHPEGPHEVRAPGGGSTARGCMGAAFVTASGDGWKSIEPGRTW